MSTIGLLAFQGDFDKHKIMLDMIGVGTKLVRKADDLSGCSALIIPGGESTTMTKLMIQNDMYAPLQEFALKRPVMGTCAGIIMLASAVDDERVKPLSLLDIRCPGMRMAARWIPLLRMLTLPSCLASPGSALFSSGLPWFSKQERMLKY